MQNYHGSCKQQKIQSKYNSFKPLKIDMQQMKQQTSNQNTWSCQDIKHSDQQEVLPNDSDFEQISTHTQSQKIKSAIIKCITNPFQYLQYCQNTKKIKIMDEQNPIFPNVYLKDISLHYKGPMEDKAYSKNYSYYTNVRRGNTLCQIYQNKTEPNSKNHESITSKFDLFFCRRGMKKFYDLEKEYLATEYEQKLTAQHLKYRRRIFEKIDQVNYEESRVHLYSIFKQNGQHCQITYVKKLSVWLFASKNVSILVRDESDLQKYYEKLRFYWAKLIAKEFLNMISQMSAEKVESLKEELDSKTLLGEHCGYEEHQHITKYDKVQIIFYGIVQKDGEDHCLPVDYCKSFLSKYNFNMSKTKEVLNLKDKNSVYQNIYTLLKETAEGTMEQYGEGSVLYVVEEKANNTQRTIAMCKLKSCEYLIFRRLREMLKLNVERKSTANTFDKFRFDIQNLIQHYFKPPQSLEFYLKVGRQAFKEASKDSNVTENYLRYKFVEFMQKVEINMKLQADEFKSKGNLEKKVLVVCLPRFTNKLQKYAKNNNIPFEYMYRNLPSNPKKPESGTGSLHILHMIPRLPEDIASISSLEIFLYEHSSKDIEMIEDQLKNSKDLTKSHLIAFIKSEDKRKSLELLNDKIIAFGEGLKNKNIKFNLIKKEIHDKDEEVVNNLEKLRENCKNQSPKEKNELEKKQEQRKIVSSSKKLFILFPLMLPGSGKSTLRQQIKSYCLKKQIPFHFIDCDQIRNKLMQSNLQEKGIQLNLELEEFNTTFSEVKDQAYQEFSQSMMRCIQNHMKNSQRDQILFVDKVFGPQIIMTEIQTLSKHKNTLPILLVPDSNQLKLKCCSFPFSLQYMLICLKRCLERQQHSTMTRLPEEIGSTFLWFLKLYANSSFKKLQMILSKTNPHAEMIKVSTLKEGEVPIHTALRKKLEQALDSHRNKNKIIELIEEMYKNTGDYLRDSSLDMENIQAVESIMNQIKKISTHY